MAAAESEHATFEPEEGRSPTRHVGHSPERAERILDAAATVFARKGYQRATTKEIAAAAGLAEGTLFNYYPSKRAMLIATIKRMTTETLPALFAMPPNDERQLIGAIIRDRLDLLERVRPLAPMLIQEFAIDEELRREFFGEIVVPLIGQAAAVVQQRIAAGDFRALNPRVALPAAAGAVAMTLIAGELLRPLDVPALGPPLERDQLIAELVDLILFGLAGRPRGDSTGTGGTER